MTLYITDFTHGAYKFIMKSLLMVSSSTVCRVCINIYVSFVHISHYNASSLFCHFVELCTILHIMSYFNIIQYDGGHIMSMYHSVTTENHYNITERIN